MTDITTITDSFIVQPYNWEYMRNFDETIVTNLAVDEIHAWVLTPRSQSEADENGIVPFSDTYLLRIKNAPLYFYLELPEYIDGVAQKWSAQNIGGVITQICKIAKHSKENKKLINYSFEEKETLHFFKHFRKSPMILLQFVNSKTLFEVAWALNKPLTWKGKENLLCSVRETEINMISKMLNIRNISHTSWITFSPLRELEDDDKESRAQREFLVSYTNIHLYNGSTSGMVTNPKIGSFDIETMTDNHLEVPNARKAKHKVYMITYTVTDNMSPKRAEKYCLTYVDYDPSKISAGAIMRKSANEVALIDDFTALIAETLPNVCISYNGFGYDWPFLNERLTRNLRSWNNCTWLDNGDDPSMKEVQYEASKFGTASSFLSMNGVIHIDVLLVIRRLMSLRSYALGYVSPMFLGHTKDPVSPKQMFETYDEWYASKKLLKKNIGSPELIARFKKAKGEMSKVVNYALEDTMLPIELFRKFNIFTSHIEGSNVFKVTIMDMITRGQQERTLLQLYGQTLRAGMVIDKQPKARKIPIAGGWVYLEVGVSDHVAILDYSSLYPSICRWKNLCYSTFLLEEDWDTVPIEDCHVFIITQSELDECNGEEIKDTRASAAKKEGAKTHEATYEYRFVKAHIRKGILPLMIENLLAERKRLKGLMKKCTDPIEKEIYNQRQLSTKVTNNSIYGFLCAQVKGKMPLQQAASVITFTGRTEILKCNKYVEDKYDAKVVFNDTDSFGFFLPGKSGKEMSELAEVVATDLNKQYEGIMSLEVEKVCRQARFAPKKYVFVPLNKDFEYVINGPEDLILKGLMAARRDISAFVKKFYEDLMCVAMRREPLINAMRMIAEHLKKLMSGEVPVKDLSISGSLSSSYSSETAFMKVFADRMKVLGHLIEPGSRVEYIIIKGAADAKNLGERMELLDRYNQMEEADRPEIDYMYYLGHKIANGFQQILTVFYSNELDEFSDEGYAPVSNRKKIRPATKPFEMLVSVMEDGHSQEEALDFMDRIFGL